MLHYELPSIETVGSFKELLDHPGVAVFHDESVAEKLSSMTGPEEIMKNVIDGYKFYFPGLHNDKIIGFSSPGNGYDELSEMHVDKSSRVVHLCAEGSVVARQTSISELSIKEGVQAMSERHAVNLALDAKPPHEDEVATSVLTVGTYMGFNGLRRRVGTLINPHAFKSKVKPRFSVTHY